MKLEDRTTLNILAKTSGSVFLVVSSIIMVRFLSKGDYGTFLQVMLICNTVIMLSFVGLPHSIFYFYPQTKDRLHLIKQTLVIGFLISFLAGIIVFFSSTFLAQLLNNQDIEKYAPLIFLIILFQGVICFRDPILLSQNYLILNSLVTLLTSIIDYIPVFIAIFLGANLHQVLYIFVCTKFLNLVFFTVTIVYTTKKIHLLGEYESKTYQRVSFLTQMKYSFPIGIASYIGIIGKQIDKYIISSFFSVSQFAVYSRGAMEIPFISTVTYTINDVSMPRYVEAYKRKDIPGFLRLMHLNIDKVAKINFGLFIFLFYEAGLLIEVLYTKQYISAVPIFQTYLFLLFLGVTVYNMIPRVTGHTHQLTVATTISILINIGLSIILIPYFGPVGAAIGTVLGSFCYMVYLLISSARVLEVSWMAIMPWLKLGRLFLVSLVPLCGVWAYHLVVEQMGISGNFWVLCGAFPVYLYQYFAVLNIVGLLHEEDKAYLARWLRFNLFDYLPVQRFGKREKATTNGEQ